MLFTDHQSLNPSTALSHFCLQINLRFYIFGFILLCSIQYFFPDALLILHYSTFSFTHILAFVCFFWRTSRPIRNASTNNYFLRKVFQPFSSLHTLSFLFCSTYYILTVCCFYFARNIGPLQLLSQPTYKSYFCWFVHSHLSFTELHSFILSPLSYHNWHLHRSHLSCTLRLTIVGCLEHVFTLSLIIFAAVSVQLLSLPGKQLSLFHFMSSSNTI